jgi:FtsZ-binding cell division protein ZapB
MSARDWVAVAIAVIVALAAGGLLVALGALMRTMTALQLTIEELRKETIPLVTDVQGTVRQANADLQRVDGLLERAESISGTVDSASRLAYLAFSNPVVKAIAFGAGTSRALRSLRRKDDG